MPRSKDPQAAVLSYFETASLPDARATQKFVAHILRRRDATELGQTSGAAAPKKGTKPAAKPRKTRKPAVKPPSVATAADTPSSSARDGM